MNEEFTYELQSVKPAESLYPASFTAPWWSAAIIAAAAIVLFVVLRWRRRVKPFDPAAVRLAAYREASDALATALAHKADASRDALAISQIIRRYLWRVTGDRLWYETSQEFASRANSLHELSDAGRIEVISLLQQIDVWKYSAATAGAQPWRDEARGLLDRLHQAMGA